MYAEVYPITDQTTETCATIYETKVVTRHGIGSRLITDQGQAFMSSFFQETCKILEISTTRTSTYHPESNETIDGWHRLLVGGLSHYVNAVYTNCVLGYHFISWLIALRQIKLLVIAPTTAEKLHCQIAIVRKLELQKKALKKLAD